MDKIVKEDINGYRSSPNSINIDFCKNELKTQIYDIPQRIPIAEHETALNRDENAFSIELCNYQIHTEENNESRRD